MVKNRMLHPKSAIERLTLLRSRGSRGVLNLKWLRNQQMANIRRFFQRKKTAIHRAVMKAGKNLTIARLQEQGPDGEDNRVKSRREKRDTELETQWRSKVLHGRYSHELYKEEVDREASLIWLTDGFMYPETEGFFMAIQDGVIKTRNYQKYRYN